MKDRDIQVVARRPQVFGAPGQTIELGAEVRDNGITSTARVELLRDILQDDAQIRLRAEPWLLELERLIGMPRRAKPPG